MNKFSKFGKTKSIKNTKQCRWLRSDEQPIFGPYLWTAFHLMSVNYPDKPTKETQNKAIGFIHGIPWLLPCSNCGYHLKTYIYKEYLPKLSLKQKLHKITSSRDEFTKFFVHAHNNVTKHTNKSKKLWSVNKAKQYYKYGYRCVSSDIIPWETAAIPRSRKIIGCKTRIYNKKGKSYCKTWKKRKN